MQPSSVLSSPPGGRLTREVVVGLSLSLLSSPDAAAAAAATGVRSQGEKKV